MIESKNINHPIADREIKRHCNTLDFDDSAHLCLIAKWCGDK